MFSNPFGGGAASSSFSQGNTMGGGGLLGGGAGLGGAGGGGGFLGRQGGVDMSLRPLGEVSEREVLNAAENKDRGRALVDGFGRFGAGGARAGEGSGIPAGVRHAPTNQDFQSLLQASMGLLNRAHRRVPAIKRALSDRSWPRRNLS